tara:strand:+ start:9487 stop:10287 length:801 start_codon:yes stop_codon:yes gene_type:complete
MYDFKYHKVSSLDQAIELLSSCTDPKIIAGGHTLIPTLKQRLSRPSDIIDITAIEGMRSIQTKDNKIIIGSLATHNHISQSSEVASLIPGLSYLASNIGDPQVRHKGTLGGSVANADPAADYPAAIIALNATINTIDSKYQSDDFFLDMFTTSLSPNDIIQNIEFNIPIASTYRKFKNPSSGYAMAGVFIAKFNDSIRVAVTGAASHAFRLTDLEEALDKNLSLDVLNNFEIDSSDFNDDIHASAKYRGNLIRVLLEEAINDISIT